MKTQIINETSIIGEDNPICVKWDGNIIDKTSVEVTSINTISLIISDKEEVDITDQVKSNKRALYLIEKQLNKWVEEEDVMSDYIANKLDELNHEEFEHEIN